MLTNMDKVHLRVQEIKGHAATNVKINNACNIYLYAQETWALQKKITDRLRPVH